MVLIAPPKGARKIARECKDTVKRLGHLKEKICAFENCKDAIWKASKGKRNRRGVMLILNNIDLYANKLKELLETNSFEPSEYAERMIFDKCCKKERKITICKFYPDQCVHWAIMLQLEPIFMRGMYQYSCASIKGRGAVYGKKYIERIRRRKNTKYTVKCDIHHYYPSIPHRQLIRALSRVIKDKWLIALTAKIIRSYGNNGVGIAIGLYLSQWLANFYLQGIDHFIKETLGCHFYIRYADDMVLLDGNRRKLRRGVDALIEQLAQLKLQIKSNWQLWRSWSRPLDFLGFKFYREHTEVRKTTFLRMRRRIRSIQKSGRLTTRQAQTVIAYNSQAAQANSYTLYNKVFKDINLARCRGVVSTAARRKNRNEQKLQFIPS